MTGRPTDPANGQPLRRAPGQRPGRAVPWLLVPTVALLAGLAMVLQAMPQDGETLAGLTRTPDLWTARVASALSGIAPSWLMLTLAGAASGMMIFMVSAGVTLVFGLMGITNFGHGAVVSLGAVTMLSVLARFGDGTATNALALSLAAVGAAAVAAMTAAAAAGALTQRVFVRPMSGSRLKRIFLTLAGLIIVEQLILMIWGSTEIRIDRPDMPNGAIAVHGVPLESYGLLAVCIGLAVFAFLVAFLRFTRTGLIVRAAMQDREMVQILGYRLRTVGVGMFIVGSALVAFGGIFWVLHHEVVTAQIGADLMVLVFITVIVGGLGSVTGCFLAALVIGLTQSYVAAVDPELALASAMAVLVLVLLWRPAGMLARPSGRAS